MVSKMVMCPLKSDTQREGGFVDGLELSQLLCAGGVSWPMKDQERLDTQFVPAEIVGGKAVKYLAIEMSHQQAMQGK